MSVFKFKHSDIFHNRIKTNPKQSFFVYDSEVFMLESFPSSTLPISSFVTKNGSLTAFSTISTSEFNEDFSYGDTLTGSSMSFFTSSIRRDYYAASAARLNMATLKNTLNHYKVVSPSYEYSSSLGDKGSQEINLISIPSIFYGSSIERRSVNLKFFTSGTLVGELLDESGNGELMQVGPVGSTGSGSVAGVVLYKEGFIVLTGSWDLEAESRNYLNDGGDLRVGSWVHFGAGIESSFPASIIPSSSFSIDFNGTQYIPTVTMLCRAAKGQLNHSNNPTYPKHGQNTTPATSSNLYRQPDNLLIKNIKKTDYLDPTGSFEKITFISRVMIYDEEMNLIAVAKTSKPIKKEADRDYTIKLKLDI